MSKPNQSKFAGVFTAIITPFKKTSETESVVDIEALENLVEFQIKSGCHGIVPVGTTGESVGYIYLSLPIALFALLN